MKIEVSVGDPQKREDVLYEKNLLRPHVMLIIEPWILYYQLLHYTNRQIWDKINEIKQQEMETKSQQYTQLASEIFQWKERRFRMKRILNTYSLVKEQKNYVHKTIQIEIPNQSLLENKLEELIYLVLEYDCLFIPHQYVSYLSQFIPSCSFSGYDENERIEKEMVPIEQITIPITSRQHVLPFIHHFIKLHA
jgi:hypothetical protein